MDLRRRPQDTSSRPPSRPPSSKSFVAALAGAMLVAGVTAMLTFPTLPIAAETAPAIPPSPSGQIVDSGPQPVPVSAAQEREIQRASFYDQHVEPQIAATDALNRKAADRCIRRIERLIGGYQSNVQPFVEDLTSISTRMSIVSQMPGGWWYNDDRVSDSIRTKFQTHLFSEESLTDDIVGILANFRSEVDANQKRMLTSVQASLTSSDLPDVDLDSYRPFFEKVAADLQDYSARQGAHSVSNGVTAILVSEAGSYVAVSLIGGLLGRMAATGAVTAAAGAGATATGGAAGAGGGSIVGPAGTVVGLIVGLGVGMAIDWYMTDQFQIELAAQMSGYLDSLEQTLLYGSPIDAQPRTPTGGMVAALPDVCDDLQTAYRERFYQQIVQPKSNP
ncbi:MAG: hypothetical protein WBD31_16750 [Rubripirellula sp.]